MTFRIKGPGTMGQQGCQSQGGRPLGSEATLGCSLKGHGYAGFCQLLRERGGGRKPPYSRRPIVGGWCAGGCEPAQKRSAESSRK